MEKVELDESFGTCIQYERIKVYHIPHHLYTLASSSSFDQIVVNKNRHYILDRTNGKVIMMSRAGEYLGLLEHPLLHKPERLACNELGDVFVYGEGVNGLLKFGLDGKFKKLLPLLVSEIISTELGDWKMACNCGIIAVHKDDNSDQEGDADDTLAILDYEGSLLQVMNLRSLNISRERKHFLVALAVDNDGNVVLAHQSYNIIDLHIIDWKTGTNLRTYTWELPSDIYCCQFRISVDALGIIILFPDSNFPRDSRRLYIFRPGALPAFHCILPQSMYFYEIESFCTSDVPGQLYACAKVGEIFTLNYMAERYVDHSEEEFASKRKLLFMHDDVLRKSDHVHRMLTNGEGSEVTLQELNRDCCSADGIHMLLQAGLVTPVSFSNIDDDDEDVSEKLKEVMYATALTGLLTKIYEYVHIVCNMDFVMDDLNQDVLSTQGLKDTDRGMLKSVPKAMRLLNSQRFVGLTGLVKMQGLSSQHERLIYACCGWEDWSIVGYVSFLRERGASDHRREIPPSVLKLGNSINKVYAQLVAKVEKEAETCQTLKHQARRAILRSIGDRSLTTLGLPNAMKSYLEYKLTENFKFGPNGGVVDFKDIKLTVHPDTVEKEIFISVVQLPRLLQRVKKDFSPFTLHLHPTTVGMKHSVGQDLTKPITIEVEFQQIIWELKDLKCNPEDGKFFILRKDSDGNVEDITDLCKAAVVGDALVYQCSSFSMYFFGWCSSKVYNILRPLMSLIGGYTVMCKLCPVFVRRRSGTVFRLICHSVGASCSGSLEHQCDDEHPKELYVKYALKIVLSWPTSELLKHVFESCEIEIDKSTCEETGSCIEIPGSSINPKMDNQVSMEVQKVSPNGKVSTILMRSIEIPPAEEKMDTSETETTEFQVYQPSQWEARSDKCSDSHSATATKTADVQVTTPGRDLPIPSEDPALPTHGTQKQIGKETMTSKFHTSLADKLKSVALIQWGEHETGTGFRVGRDYVITNHHVVEQQFDSMGQPVQGASVFNFFESQSQSIGYIPFAVHPLMAHSPKEQLDFAVLKLDPTRQLPQFAQKYRQPLPAMPPPLTKFCGFNNSTFTKITFIGHPRGLHQVVDPLCEVKHPQTGEEGFKEELAKLKRTFGDDVFKQYDDVNRVLYDTSVDFDAGNSGSPGFVPDMNGNACVTAVHARAYMTRLTQKNLPPHEYSVEQGVRIEAISRFLETHHNQLWMDIFQLA